MHRFARVAAAVTLAVPMLLLAAGAPTAAMELGATMANLHAILTEAYNATCAVVVPGNELSAMEAAARQVGHQGQVMILNGGASAHAWKEILARGQVAYDVFTVQPEWTTRDGFRVFQPLASHKVVPQIKERRPDVRAPATHGRRRARAHSKRSIGAPALTPAAPGPHAARSLPQVVFASHVDASTGLLLPDEYLAAIGRATREANGLFVLDGAHAGPLWVDMEASMVDLYIAAPQRGSLDGKVRPRARIGTSPPALESRRSLAGALAHAGGLRRRDDGRAGGGAQARRPRGHLDSSTARPQVLAERHGRVPRGPPGALRSGPAHGGAGGAPRRHG